MKRALLTLAISLFLTSVVFSQINTVWYQSTGSTMLDNVASITTDLNGNVYITGQFTGSVDFDPSPTSTYMLSTGAGHTQPDIFIQKLDANGNFLWAKRYGSSGDYSDAGFDVAVDDSGNVYVSGWYTNDIQFIPNDTIFYGGTSNWSRPFLVKLDSAGNTLWGMGWKNTTNQPTNARNIEIDDWGRVHMCGFVRGTMDFDPTHYSTQNHTSSGVWDAFITRIKPNGRVDKVRLIGNVGWDYSYSTAIDGEDIYFVGVFQNSVDFSTTSTPDILVGSSSGSCFITKIDTSYNHKWAKAYGAGGQPISVVLSPSRKLYTTGNFTNSADFDPSANTHTLTSNGNQDVFIQVLDSSGAFIDAYSFGGTGEDRPYDIDVSSNEDISIVGRFNNTVDFDPKAGSYNVTSNGANDAYVLKLDSACSFIQVAQFGGTGGETFYATHFINNNELYAGGSFQNTIDVNPHPLYTQNITSAGQSDIITVLLSTCSFTYSNMQVSACDSYTVPSGNATYTSSGTYSDTISSTQGCDSILTINLTIHQNNINANVIQTIDGLEAQATGTNLSYQWLDCSTNQLVTGANGQTFMPSVNGDYSVIVDDGNCTDTSACFTIQNVSISESDLHSQISIYPNPTTGLVKIECAMDIKEIQVLDLTGRVVLRNLGQSFVDISTLTSGVYLLQVDTEDGVVLERIVKE